MSNGNESPPQSPRSPDSNASEVLTPRRKVQALLAQVSDSESDRESIRSSSSLSEGVGILQNQARSSTHNDDEVGTSMPGRLAARVLGKTTPDDILVTDIAAPSNNPSDVSTSRSAAPAFTSLAEEARADEAISEDESVKGHTKRRRPVSRRSDRSATSTPSKSARSRGASPMFFPSAQSSPQSAAESVQSTRPNMAKSTENERSKFLALVERHRKERLVREAAEIAKRAARSHEDEPESLPKRAQRGSSPADDSEDENASDDNGAVQRISKQSRPTRKASKKALEEMNRETQRMSRSMQLTHQARTKTRISKDSLLARFNFVPAVVPSVPADRSSQTSSVTGSDGEHANDDTTPPTSPIERPDLKIVEERSQDHSRAVEMAGALGTSPDSGDTIKSGNMSEFCGYDRIQEYISNNKTVFSPSSNTKTSNDAQHVRLALAQPPIVFSAPSRHLWKGINALHGSDSDSEIEIVKDRGSRRKYAAFETLSKTKAKEMPSHIALRSLAHLVTNDAKKHSMNAAEMEVWLRKKARLQAVAERNQKIEQLRAKGVVIQTAEERERDQQEVEDLVERARQEAAEIQRREIELAKKQGTYVRDGLDDDEDESDDDFEEESNPEDEYHSELDEEDDEEGGHLAHDTVSDRQEGLIDDEVDEAASDDEENVTEIEGDESDDDHAGNNINDHPAARTSRKQRIISDDEDEELFQENDKENHSPVVLRQMKTPQSLTRSARKVIPGLQMSDDLPMGLSQAFAATMAESQDDVVEHLDRQNSPDLVAELPSPNIALVPHLQRLDSVDMVSDSLPASQTQPLNVNLNFSQNQLVPESPSLGLGISALDFTPSQRPFELTQDAGYLLSPFAGSRFHETPSRIPPQSTVDTEIIPANIEDSPVLLRKGRLRRGKDFTRDEGIEQPSGADAFKIMKQNAGRKERKPEFNKSRSEARQHFDEAAEESEDEYAGLGGASDEDVDDEENEDDRKMIDEDTQVGVGDEAKLAGFYADRERQQDEKDVSKLLKDITTGALRRKRGAGDDLDLSDEEDAAARRREAKRREFARMRRELLKDEAVGKIAEDKKKEAFFRSIEDREEEEDDEDDNEDFEEPGTQSQNVQNQSQTSNTQAQAAEHQTGPDPQWSKLPLARLPSASVNTLAATRRRGNTKVDRRPANLAEIRESVSFLIEEADSQAAVVDLGLSDSEEEPEAYVDLDRHLQDAQYDENALDEDTDDLGGFIVDDEPSGVLEFKKPMVPGKERAPFSDRRTKRENVVDRLTLLRQASSSSAGSVSGSSSNSFGKMAFFSSKAGTGPATGVPSLLRRATTNSSLGSLSGRENVSATGVSTNNGVTRTERGDAAHEKEFIRKGSNGRQNAVNYQGRATLREEKMSQRAGIARVNGKGKRKGGNGFLSGLFREDSWL